MKQKDVVLPKKSPSPKTSKHTSTPWGQHESGCMLLLRLRKSNCESTGLVSGLLKGLELEHNQNGSVVGKNIGKC